MVIYDQLATKGESICFLPFLYIFLRCEIIYFQLKAAVLRSEGQRIPRALVEPAVASLRPCAIWLSRANTMLVTEALPHGCGVLSLRTSIALILKESPTLKLRTAKNLNKVTK